ncbi:MAG: DUF2085 domain-containing protein [Thermoplasmata archaeon]|nr:DUF2085 domain-containing protein [Thermoplasmata archaeon]
MDAFESILTLLGSSLCHQLAERSYVLDGFQMPLCVRCLGLHVGFLISFALIWFQKGRPMSGLPSTRSLVIFGVMMMPAVADVALSYSGVIDSDNVRRAITGALFGTCIAFIVLPLARALVSGSSPVGRSMTHSRDWAALLIVASVSSIMVVSAESSKALFYFLAVAGIVGVFVSAWSLITLLTLLLTEDRAWGKKMKLATASIATPLFLISLAALHGLLS